VDRYPTLRGGEKAYHYLNKVEGEDLTTRAACKKRLTKNSFSTRNREEPSEKIELMTIETGWFADGERGEGKERRNDLFTLYALGRW